MQITVFSDAIKNDLNIIISNKYKPGHHISNKTACAACASTQPKQDLCRPFEENLHYENMPIQIY